MRRGVMEGGSSELGSTARRFAGLVGAALIASQPTLGCARVLGMDDLDFSAPESGGSQQAGREGPGSSVPVLGDDGGSGGTARTVDGAGNGGIDTSDGGAAGGGDFIDRAGVGGSAAGAGAGGGGEGGEPGGCADDSSQPLSCLTNLSCPQSACGGYLWEGGFVPYQLEESLSPRQAELVNEAAWAWSDAFAGIQLVQCEDNACERSYPRWLSVRLGQTSLSPSVPDGEQLLELAAKVSPERVAHELGHVLGLPDVWRRPDRDRHLKLSESAFCGSSSRWDASTCRVSEPQPWSRPYRPTTGLFGPFDTESAMNLAGPDVCEAVEPEHVRKLPTANDRAALIELYRTGDGWSPFATLGRDVGPGRPLENTLAPGVTPIGSPTLASTGYPRLIAYVLGSDRQLYYKDTNWEGDHYGDWSDWGALGGCCFDSDPAAVSWNALRLDVFVRGDAGDLRWLYWDGAANVVSNWSSLAPPDVGAASAPVVVSNAPGHLGLFVRGGDGALYWRSYAGVWEPDWKRLGEETFVGKPAVAMRVDGTVEVVVATGEGALRHQTFSPGSSVGQTLEGPIAPGTSPTLVVAGDALHLLVSNASHHLAERILEGTSWGPWRDLGGLISGSPGALGSLGRREVHVAAAVPEGGSTGVWVRSWPAARPCYIEAACGTCAESCIGNVCQKPSALVSTPTHYTRFDGSDALIARAVNSHLYYFARESAGWRSFDLSTNSIGKTALAVTDTSAYLRTDGYESVLYRAMDNQVSELTLVNKVWTYSPLSDLASAPDANGAPFGHLRSDGYNVVDYHGVDHHIHEIYLFRGYWYDFDLSGYLGAPNASGDAVPFIRADDDDAVIYRTEDDRLQELYLTPTSWFASAVTSASVGVEVLGNPAAYVRSDLRNAIVYRGVDKQIHEASADWNGHDWIDVNLSIASSAGHADDAPSGYVRADGTDSVVYRGDDEHVYELHRNGAGWSVTNVSEAAGAPSAGSNVTPYVRSDGRDAIAYVTADGRLLELVRDAEAWDWEVIFDGTWR